MRDSFYVKISFSISKNIASHMRLCLYSLLYCFYISKEIFQPHIYFDAYTHQRSSSDFPQFSLRFFFASISLSFIGKIMIQRGAKSHQVGRIKETIILCRKLMFPVSPFWTFYLYFKLISLFFSSRWKLKVFNLKLQNCQIQFVDRIFAINF